MNKFCGFGKKYNDKVAANKQQQNTSDNEIRKQKRRRNNLKKYMSIFAVPEKS